MSRSISKRSRKKQNNKRKNVNKTSPSVPSTKTCSSENEKIEMESLVIKINYFGDGEKDDQDDFTLKNAKKLHQIGHNFTTVLQMLWKYINSIGLLAESTSNTSMATVFILLDEIEKIEKTKSGKHIAEINVKLIGKDKDGNQKNEDKTIKIFDKEHLSKIIEFNNHNRAASTILHDTAIQQLINAWEKLLADLVNWFYTNNPDRISNQKHISFNKLLQISDLDELKQTIIDSEIKSFLGENTTQEQIKFFDDNFKTNFKSFFHKFDQLIFIIYVRHLIVHYGGIVTKEFETKIGKLKNIKHSLIVTRGEKIELTPEFIKNSWETIYLAGVLLVHRIAKNQTPHQIEILDNFLNNSAFANIQKEQFTSAVSILEYADSIHIAKTRIFWSVKINLAQTYKWQGENEKFQKVIDDIDIDAANSRFQLCVAALTEDSETFVFKLNEVSINNLVTVSELYEWPVFSKMRENPEFNKWVEDAYGCKLSKLQALLQPKLLDLSPKSTINMISDYYEEKHKKMLEEN